MVKNQPAWRNGSTVPSNDQARHCVCPVAWRNETPNGQGNEPAYQNVAVTAVLLTSAAASKHNTKPSIVVTPTKGTVVKLSFITAC